MSVSHHRLRWFVLAGLLVLSFALGLFAQAPEPPRKLALVVGVNVYDLRVFNDKPLRFAENDADELAGALKGLGFEVVVLKGSSKGPLRATKANIERQLELLLAKVKHADDIVLVSLCGHGQELPVKSADGKEEVDAPFFCPVDAVHREATSQVSLNYLINDRLAKKGGKNLLLIDACRDQPKDPSRGARGVQGKKMALPSNTAVFFSCKSGQIAFETEEESHGLFTWCVLEGLRGSAAQRGVLTWASLVADVENRMESKKAKRLLPRGHKQVPIAVNNIERVVLGGVPSTLGSTATDLAHNLGAGLVKRAPKERGEKYRVAVFPFGNSEGRYTLDLGNNGPALRGALVDALRAYLAAKAPGKFTVLFPEQVNAAITSGSTDPIGISGKNLALARRLLKEYDLQVGIVGGFDVKSLAAVAHGDEDRNDKEDEGHGTGLWARAILPDDTFSVGSKVETGELLQHGIVPQQGPLRPRRSGRLAVRFKVKVATSRPDNDPSAWKQVPLKVSMDADTRGLLYLVVPRAYRNKRYSVELVNKGRPVLFHNPKYDPDRLFSAAVLIDGVSGFMLPDDSVPGKYRVVSGEPSSLPRWILTPVGKRMVPDKKGMRDKFEKGKRRVEGGKLIRAKGADGSVIRVRGFQKDNRVASSFVFSTAASSVAAPELLPLKKIGTISVYFFAEALSRDREDATDGDGDDDGPGTKLGRDVPSPTFRVKVLNWAPEPFEVWHIIYRYEGDPTLPRNLRPLSSPKAPQMRKLSRPRRLSLRWGG